MEAKISVLGQIISFSLSPNWNGVCDRMGWDR